MSSKQDKIISLNALNLKIFKEMTRFFSASSVFFKKIKKITNNFPSSMDSEKKYNTLFDDVFTEELQGIGASIMDKIDGIEYIEHYMPLALSTVDFERANQLIQKINHTFPLLKPLDEKLNSNELFIYSALLKTDIEEKEYIEKFLNCFYEVFDKMQEKYSVSKVKINQPVIKNDYSYDQRRNFNMIAAYYFEAAETNNVPELISCLAEVSSLGEKVPVDMDHWKGGTAISIAVIHDSRDVVARLLELNGDPLKRYHPSSAIAQAIELNRNECLDMIMKSGAVDMQSSAWSNGLYSLQSVIFNSGSHSSLEVLLKNNLDPDMKLYGTPIIFEAMHEKDYDALCMLVKYGADTSVYNRSGETLFTDALLRKDEEDLDMLALNNLCYFDGKLTGLRMYCLSNGVPLYDALQRFKIKSEWIVSGKNVFHHVVEYADIEACRSLLDAGADVNAITEDGNNVALTLNGNQVIFKLLLEYGGDMNFKLNGVSVHDILLESRPHLFFDV